MRSINSVFHYTPLRRQVRVRVHWYDSIPVGNLAPWHAFGISGSVCVRCAVCVWIGIRTISRIIKKIERSVAEKRMNLKKKQRGRNSQGGRRQHRLESRASFLTCSPIFVAFLCRSSFCAFSEDLWRKNWNWLDEKRQNKKKMAENLSPRLCRCSIFGWDVNKIF